MVTSNWDEMPTVTNRPATERRTILTTDRSLADFNEVAMIDVKDYDLETEISKCKFLAMKCDETLGKLEEWIGRKHSIRRWLGERIVIDMHDGEPFSIERSQKVMHLTLAIGGYVVLAAGIIIAVAKGAGTFAISSIAISAILFAVCEAVAAEYSYKE